ncbi:MAG: UDP-N-acetylglucosamine 2-epimerase (non-hydrolyzing) [Actinomycetaceae bacterium]|nr:UDP-N-acetylglucosamine 2-epimerase (non-hydrolyzing) [Actinomycetaceae bacterium]MDY6082333.1 UDP-N-acetylglucosamine 2-epimerase (non-hydrolyzing) [Actinomycetaceae bacterium]
MKTIMIVYGTRPEGIKIAPLVLALSRAHSLKPLVVSTRQHTDMLDQVNTFFGITPDVTLDVFRSNPSLNLLSARILDQLDPLLVEHAPDALLVQGDTTTVMAAGIAAFYRRIPLVHLEAGLRSGNIMSPYPEEANRKIVSQIAALHLAPTPEARDNLLGEHVRPENIAVTGNTVIDALHYTVSQDVPFTDPSVQKVVDSGRRILLVTSHRRESIGEPMQHTARALAQIADLFPEDVILFPIHKNPAVRDIFVPALDPKPNVVFTEPLDYPQFAHALDASHIVLTDSGGVQEEAPSLGKPVLVLRDNTERPEAITAGTVKLVGTDTERIVFEVTRLKNNPDTYRAMATAVNPYGDGHATERSIAAIEQLLGIGTRKPDFAPHVVPRVA